MSPLLEIGVGVAIVLNTGLLWTIAHKVGCLDGKMKFVVDKMKEYNGLLARVSVLEAREWMRDGRQDPGTVEPGR